MCRNLIFSLLLIISSLQIVEAETPCGKTNLKYYSWAELKSFPPHPSHPESEHWAQNQEQAGRSYYVAEYCENGDIVSLTKYLEKKAFFRYEYIYDNRILTAVDLIDAGGVGKKRFHSTK